MAKGPKSRSGSSGRLTYQPASDEGPIPKTLVFVEAQLPAWRDDPKRPPASSEKRLNSSLCDFLESRARFECPMVRFKHEAPQTATRTVDMGVHGTGETTLLGTYCYTVYEPFMVIECKRLPAPSSDREREYVAGTSKASGGATGGIQRFKLGEHGSNVETAAIVGYVEKHSAQHWMATINQWIADLAGKTSADGCVWTEGDKLRELVCDEHQATATAVSNHRRNNACRTNAIKLHHLWVIMHSGSN